MRNICLYDWKSVILAYLIKYINCTFYSIQWQTYITVYIVILRLHTI